MEGRRARSLSRFLALVLRHRPEAVGIDLDTGGWVEVDRLIEALAATDRPITRSELDALVAGNDKQRFAYSADGRRIRANQGHSLPVDLGLAPCEPPAVLYHGTVGRVLPAVLREGLRPMGRQDVHLSADIATAVRVASRRGRPVVLQVDATALHAAGQVFRRSANGVWLTDSVPPDHLCPLRLPDG